MKKFLFTLTSIISCAYINAQSGDWVEQMDDPSVNFYTVQQNFEQYWQERQIEKGKGWKQFKRWEAFMEPRVYPDGERPGASVMMETFQFMQNGGITNLGQWKPIGPYNGNAIEGIGRINRIAFDPTDSQTLWIGAPAGGLWKSTNGGQTWNTNTDKLANLGISDIVINPQDRNVMYIATGDRDAGDTYSFGVLKSTDGGQTWNSTGLVHNITQQIKVTDLYIHPGNTDTLLASTSQGIYRSTDAGVNWTRTQIGSFNAMVQKPGNPNILFCTSLSSPRIYKSTDNGQSWSQVVSTALPAGNIRRIELAVTPDDSNYIYALYGRSSDNGFLSICRSTDGGTTWTEQANSPNLLGWSTNGSDAGGQAWYDLALAVSPTDKNEVYVGGVNIWRSTNGGSNWNIASHWYGGGGNPFVHADVHHLIYHPVTGHLYAGTDGGVYRHKNGQFNWDPLNDGINITQYYKMGTSASDTSLIIAGAQDNGTHLKSSWGWDDVYGGDGMDCAINSKDNDIMYASIYYGDFVKSTDGGNSFFANFNLPPAGNGNWVTPFLLDPAHPDTIYTGFSQVWRSFNGGQNFTQLTNSTSGSGNIDVLGIAPGNTNVVFMVNANRLYRSNDYGDTWTRLSALTVARAISSVAAAYDNPDHIVVTISGYSSNEKVFETRDGGQSWSNLSSGLPNVPVNCVTIEDNSEHSIYIGTDIGVFYRDDLSSGWTRFNADLPNVIVNDLEINYINRKLRAATYGRGVWETPLYSDLVEPNAKMNLPQSVCLSDTITLYDASQYSPDDFRWYISPASYTYVNGSSDTSQNPQVVFTQKGFYNISLAVQNLLGEDSTFEAGAIAVGGYPLPFSEDMEDLTDFTKWSIPDMDPSGWSRISVGNEHVLKASLFNNTIYKNHEIISPAIDFSGHDSVWMAFDYAYSGQTGNSDDSLLVFISTGCSEAWTQIGAFGEDGSNNFRTAAAGTNAFVPSPGQWCGNFGFASCPAINLSGYAGMEGVRLKFVAVNKGGNHLYLDNIILEGNPTVAPTPDFSGNSTACALDTILFKDQSYGSPQTWSWHFSGPDNITSQDRNPLISFQTPGSYSVELKITNSVGADSVIKTSFITVNPADSVSLNLNYNGNFVCSTDTLSLTANSVNAGNGPLYKWYLNGSYVGKTRNGSYDFTGLTNGDTIYASLISDLDCAFPNVAYSDTAIINGYPVATVQVNPVGKLCSTGNTVPLSATPAGGTFSGAGVSGNNFDPSASGPGIHAVTYTYQDTNGCTYRKKLNVEVERPEEIVINQPIICEGDNPKALNMAYPSGGTYTGPGITNNVLDPSIAGEGTHSVTYTYPSPSCGPITKTFTLNILPTDTPQVYVGNNEMVCSITANQYQWFDANGNFIPGANSKTFKPTTNGSYRVDILSSNGCYASSDLVSFTIGLEEIPDGMDFKLYPNPASEKIFLEISGASGIQELELNIFNAIGARVSKEIVEVHNQLEKEIEVGHFSPGVYTIVLKGKNILINRKIVIQR